MAKLVSKTYGDALFEVALEKNQLDEFLDEVKAAQTAIEENKELFKLMSHPKIVKEEKIKIITDIFTGKVSEELVGLLRMIVDKGHFEQVDSVFTYFIEFNIMGRDYDAAVLVAGTCGFGMGATPNAMANMQALCDRYVPSVKAYLLIPLVGSLFADFINSLVITFFINIL